MNKRGLTLIEVLAGLTIVSFLILVIWSVFVSGIRSSKITENKIRLEQEANLFMTTIRTIHYESNSYTIEMNQNPDADSVFIHGDQSFTFSNPNISYSLYKLDTNGESLLQTPFTVIPETDNLRLKLVLTNKQQTDQTFDLSTTLQNRSSLLQLQ